ncbi:hypothetical protein DCAR_0102627 [Daucus carota subsp. sativus]|uniref:Uncharacterized protein n=1 Tax=Daucus carota subsp. sativus TaxID=79200 RepID=A0A169WTH1_DAUCS|nr:hypothetical protein DCAR_0102627 [Daucus carota subsp. sativus]
MGERDNRSKQKARHKFLQGKESLAAKLCLTNSSLIISCTSTYVHTVTVPVLLKSRDIRRRLSLETVSNFNLNFQDTLEQKVMYMDKFLPSMMMKVTQ